MRIQVASLFDNKTNPEHRAVQKFSVFLTFPVTTCVLKLPSHITAPPRSSITCITKKQNKLALKNLIHLIRQDGCAMMSMLDYAKQDKQAGFTFVR